MELAPIFVSENDACGLYAVHFPEKEKDEFVELWRKLRSLEYLSDKFHDLFDEEFEKALLDISNQIVLFNKKIKDCANNTIKGNLPNLQELFVPLNNNEYSIKELQKSKAKLNKKSSLRIYAIRIAVNCYVITGGGIKLVDKMDETAELRFELQKLNRTRDWLRDNNCCDLDDLENL